MTDAEIRAIEQITVTPAQRLVVALAGVHAARTAAIRHLTLEDLDLPNRRITLAGYAQRLGELTQQALLTWLEHIRADRVLHEALTVGPDPLHLALVFNLAHTTANRYAAFAQNILDDSHTIPRRGDKRVTARIDSAASAGLCGRRAPLVGLLAGAPPTCRHRRPSGVQGRTAQRAR